MGKIFTREQIAPCVCNLRQNLPNGKTSSGTGFFLIIKVRRYAGWVLSRPSFARTGFHGRAKPNGHKRLQPNTRAPMPWEPQKIIELCLSKASLSLWRHRGIIGGCRRPSPHAPRFALDNASRGIKLRAGQAVPTLQAAGAPFSQEELNRRAQKPDLESSGTGAGQCV